MIFKQSIKINQLLLNKLKCVPSVNDQIKTILNCIEGDFILYHGTYAQAKPVKFIFHFLKSLIYRKKYSFTTSRDKLNPSSIASLVTAENIYKENLKPLIDKLNLKGYEHFEYRLKINKSLSFDNFRFQRDHIFSIRELFSKNMNLLTFSNVIKLLYIKYILIEDCLKLINFLEKEVSKEHSIFLSAEICDTFSRAMAAVCKSHKIRYIIFQPGPFETHETLEVQSVMADELIAWSSSKNYFLNPINKIFDETCKLSFFDSVRFLLDPKSNNTKKYDLVFFLTWLSIFENKDRLNQQLRDTLKYLSEKTELEIFLKMHPSTFENQEKEYLKEYKNYKFLNKNLSSIDVINQSKLILNFGSTVSFDSDFLNVKTGIINFDKDIDDDHHFFSLNHIKNLNDLNDLNDFINNFHPKSKKINKGTNKDIISYIEGYL